LGTEAFIAPRGDFDSVQQHLLSNASREVVWHENDGTFPPAWIVHHWETWPPLMETTRRAMATRTRDVFLSKGQQLRDFAREAIVEASEVSTPPPVTDPPTSPETCEVIRSSAELVRIKVSLQQPGILVLSDQFFPGWNAYVKSESAGNFRPTSVFRTNRVMRGVLLPAGEQEVQFRYEPKSVRIGAWVSVLSWLVGIATVAATYRTKSES
jgi:hypothetical protein